MIWDAGFDEATILGAYRKLIYFYLKVFQSFEFQPLPNTSMTLSRVIPLKTLSIRPRALLFSLYLRVSLKSNFERDFHFDQHNTFHLPFLSFIPSWLLLHNSTLKISSASTWKLVSHFHYDAYISPCVSAARFCFHFHALKSPTLSRLALSERLLWRYGDSLHAGPLSDFFLMWANAPERWLVWFFIDYYLLSFASLSEILRLASLYTDLMLFYSISLSWLFTDAWILIRRRSASRHVTVITHHRYACKSHTFHMFSL